MFSVQLLRRIHVAVVLGPFVLRLFDLTPLYNLQHFLIALSRFRLNRPLAGWLHTWTLPER
jgi:hypothetical protein